MDVILNYLLLIVEPLVSKLGHFGVFIGMIFESACIPLPSELILPFTGYLVWQGKLNLWIATLAGTLGNVVGSFLAYWVGLHGGKPFILKYGRYFFVSPKQFHTAESWFNKYGEPIIFFSRLLPIIRTFISLPAGVTGMNLTRFLLYTILGSLPWSFIWIYLGMKLGKHWQDLSPIFHELDYVTVTVLFLALAYIVIKKLRK